EQILDAAGGDFLGLVTQNASASKLELFLHRSMHVDSTIDPTTGTMKTTVRITLRNDAPTSGHPGYVIGNALGLPTGTNRMYLSLSSSLPTTRATLSGHPVAMELQDERGLHVSSAFVTVPAGGTATLEVQLSGNAPFRPASGGAAYQLRVLHQPMVNA